MSKIKNKMANARGFQEVGFAAGFKGCSTIMLIVMAVLSTHPIFAQKKDATAAAKPTTEDAYKRMVDYSRPGKNHQLWAALVGNWSFKVSNYDMTSGKRLENMNFTGTLVREPFADGRYFIVHVLADSTMTMDVPSQTGEKMVEKFRVLDVEGYDNVKKKFITSSISNNLFSGIRIAEGAYDPGTKTITLYSQVEDSPGIKSQEKLLYILHDNSHYTMEFHTMANGKYRKETVVDFTRSN
jgi:hypothetical protein